MVHWTFVDTGLLDAWTLGHTTSMVCLRVEMIKKESKKKMIKIHEYSKLRTL